MVDIHRIPSYIVLLDVLHHQLQRRVAVVGVLLDGVADIERLHVLDMRIVLVHAECNAVYRCVRLVVDQFQFDMFQIFPYQLAGPVILDSERAEHGFLVVRAERIHHPPVGDGKQGIPNTSLRSYGRHPPHPFIYRSP